jgi:hypothetical protein
MRLTFLLSILIFLTSCSSSRLPYPSQKVEKKVIPEKLFSYAYQQPSRVLAGSGVSKQLSSPTFGRTYFSASGYECRRYNLSSGASESACKIGKRWYTPSPVFLAN